MQQTGRTADAIDTLNQAIRLDASQPAYHYNLGEAHRSSGQLDRAATSYRRAIELEPAAADAHYNLGNVLYEQRQLLEAGRSYERANRLEPDDGEILLNFGNALIDLGDPERALDCFRRAQAAMPDAHGVKVKIGSALIALGRIGLVLVVATHAPPASVAWLPGLAIVALLDRRRDPSKRAVRLLAGVLYYGVVASYALAVESYLPFTTIVDAAYAAMVLVGAPVLLLGRPRPAVVVVAIALFQAILPPIGLSPLDRAATGLLFGASAALPLLLLGPRVARPAIGLAVAVALASGGVRGRQWIFYNVTASASTAAIEEIPGVRCIPVVTRGAIEGMLASPTPLISWHFLAGPLVETCDGASLVMGGLSRTHRIAPEGGPPLEALDVGISRYPWLDCERNRLVSGHIPATARRSWWSSASSPSGSCAGSPTARSARPTPSGWTPSAGAAGGSTTRGTSTGPISTPWPAAPGSRAGSPATWRSTPDPATSSSSTRAGSDAWTRTAGSTWPSWSSRTGGSRSAPVTGSASSRTTPRPVGSSPATWRRAGSPRSTSRAGGSRGPCASTGGSATCTSTSPAIACSSGTSSPGPCGPSGRTTSSPSAGPSWGSASGPWPGLRRGTG